MGRYVARAASPGQGGVGWAGKGLGALLYHCIMTDPLSLSAGIAARLIAAAALLVLLWSGVAWALAA